MPPITRKQSSTTSTVKDFDQHANGKAESNVKQHNEMVNRRSRLKLSRNHVDSVEVCSTASVYEVAKIVKHRGRGERMELLVRWKGWSAAEDTWEPMDNIHEGSADALKTYLKQCGLCKQMKEVLFHQVRQNKLYYRVEWDDENGNYMETLEEEDNVSPDLILSYWRGGK
jgi:hypothetical protein